jgi:hypothetical protein
MMSSAVARDIHGCEADSVFFCPEESRFYAQCLKSLVFTRDWAPKSIVEFGSGDGSPVMEALYETHFAGHIEGFELDPVACDIAKANIKASQLENRYTVTNACFLSHAPIMDCLIANPPYLPAPDRNIRLPLLYGGGDGSLLTNALLSLSYSSAVLMISSYSNPAGTLRHAATEGYAVSDFIVAPLTFGPYSSELKVKHRIEALRKAGRAFYDGDMYLLAGVLFTKRRGRALDRSAELSQNLTSI